jgi:hypothetical protein
MEKGLIGIVGLQGVGKSSALQAIYQRRVEQEDGQRAGKAGVVRSAPQHAYDTVLFKWRRENELSKSLLDGSHEASESFIREYLPDLWRRRLSSIAINNSSEKQSLNRLQLLSQESKSMVSLARMARNDANFYASDTALAEVNRLEDEMGRAVVGKLRDAAWLRILRKRHVVLIDTPDYSKTDRRLMEKDLEGIYWLWNRLARSANVPHNLIVAIQKEMFRGHFFFDKMQSIELKPLKPERMVEAYRHQFNSLKPFTPEALPALARMSRGIFRRFLRYITLTLDLWEDRHRGGGDRIDVATVEAAVTTERLAEDMELELSELFPKHSDLRLLAVRLLMLLEKSGERKQGELADLLEVQSYMLSRLLTRLEAARYVARSRVGNDKIVSLYSQKRAPDTSSNPVLDT